MKIKKIKINKRKRKTFRILALIFLFAVLTGCVNKPDANKNYKGLVNEKLRPIFSANIKISGMRDQCRREMKKEASSDLERKAPCNHRLHDYCATVEAACKDYEHKK